MFQNSASNERAKSVPIPPNVDGLKRLADEQA